MNSTNLLLHRSEEYRYHVVGANLAVANLVRFEETPATVFTWYIRSQGI